MKFDYDFFDTFDFFKFFVYIVFFTCVFVLSSSIFNSEFNLLQSKVDLYEKILNREYDRTFESYEDYLLYRIEIGK